MARIGLGSYMVRYPLAARDVNEAASAIDTIAGDYDRHVRWAREIAIEHLDARNVPGGMLNDLGIQTARSQTHR